MSEHLESRHEDGRHGMHPESAMDRRGVLGWVAAIAATGVAWLTGAGSSEASHNSSGTPGADSIAIHVDQTNAVSPSGGLSTVLVSPSPSPSFVSFKGAGSPTVFGTPDCLQGFTTLDNASAVRGYSEAATGGVGVTAIAPANGTAIVGLNGFDDAANPTGIGVYGQSLAASGRGVLGQIGPFNVAAGIGVYGANFSTNAGPGPGAGGFGCYGYSARGHGLVGATGTAGGGAVIGATNSVPGAYAGIFYGPLVVTGAKNAAVPHPDGTHRLLYCVESPESWFEDFGEARLASGTVTIAIDPEFAQVANLDRYHVFVTAYDDTPGLHVSSRTPTCFTVTERDGGSSSVAFSWRIVAKRKDITGERLAKITLPQEPAPPAPLAPRSTSTPPIVAVKTHTHAVKRGKK